jgi:hypothetical protein
MLLGDAKRRRFGGGTIKYLGNPYRLYIILHPSDHHVYAISTYIQVTLLIR